jgi:hypothetical protein
MKLGVSYNVFDSEELLEGSIKQIRDSVNFISVVYQTKSNFGNPCNENLVPLLKKMKEEGLIDYLFEYKPNVNLGAGFNEVIKRNIGLSLSTRNACTHHMSMDADEYYIQSQFELLKEQTIENDLDSSYCQMKTYYKSWEYQLDPPEEYYVSLIFKIKENNSFEFAKNCPAMVDPTRRMEPGNYKIFKRNEIEMHHGSYIRNDVKLKLENSSACDNFREHIHEIVDYYDKWEFPKPAFVGGRPCVLHNIKKVEKLFN